MTDTPTITLWEPCEHKLHDPHGWCSYIPTHGDGSLKQRHENDHCPGIHSWCPGGRERTFRKTTVGDTVDGRPGWLNTPVWVEVSDD